MIQSVSARFSLGQVVRLRHGELRGVIIDADPTFAGPPADTGGISPDQPFYEVLALGEGGGFIAYAPEDALECDPQTPMLSAREERRYFNVDSRGRRAPRACALH